MSKEHLKVVLTEQALAGQVSLKFRAIAWCHN